MAMRAESLCCGILIFVAQAGQLPRFGLADSLRDQIDELGYVIEDTAQGARVVPKA